MGETKDSGFNEATDKIAIRFNKNENIIQFKFSTIMYIHRKTPILK